MRLFKKNDRNAIFTQTGLESKLGVVSTLFKSARTESRSGKGLATDPQELYDRQRRNNSTPRVTNMSDRDQAIIKARLSLEASVDCIAVFIDLRIVYLTRLPNSVRTEGNDHIVWR